MYNALDQRIGIQESGGRDVDDLQRLEPRCLALCGLQRIGHSADSVRLGAGDGQRCRCRRATRPDELGGTTAWYLTDKLDSVRDVVSSAGSVLDHVVYDSFGNVTTETNASNGDRFKFAGMESDSSEG